MGTSNGELEAKPRYREIDACDHCHRWNNPYTPRPEPAQAIWQKRGNEADHESADGGRSHPPVPVHLWREEIQNGIGKIAGTVSTQKDDALRRIHGKQRKPAQPRDDIEERKCRPERKDEAANCRSGHHDPKPLMLFMTWPTRKDHQTMKARRTVRVVRM